VRLNYDVLGQNIVDPVYLGLMTHVGTYRDVSEMDLPHTWGRRYAGADDTPHLSSVNPYMLVEARQDHFGRFAHVENPTARPYELTTVTVLDALAIDAPALPDAFRGKVPSDLLLRIAEWVPDQDYHQLRTFLRRAGRAFVLKAPGHADVQLEVDGVNLADGQGTLQLFGVRVAPDERTKVVPRVKYTLEPVNTSSRYRWTTKPGLTVVVPAALGGRRGAPPRAGAR
jgi:hypothetical protein